MDDLTIYEKYDKLLNSNTNLSVVSAELEEKLKTCKAAFGKIYDNCSDTDLIIDICDYHVKWGGGNIDIVFSCCPGCI